MEEPRRAGQASSAGSGCAPRGTGSTQGGHASWRTDADTLQCVLQVFYLPGWMGRGYRLFGGSKRRLARKILGQSE